jgi:hypothetical protein
MLEGLLLVKGRNHHRHAWTERPFAGRSCGQGFRHVSRSAPGSILNRNGKCIYVTKTWHVSDLDWVAGERSNKFRWLVKISIRFSR